MGHVTQSQLIETAYDFQSHKTKIYEQVPQDPEPRMTAGKGKQPFTLLTEVSQPRVTS
jgi:hypothetical protein